MDNSDQDIPSPLPPEMRSSGDLTPRKTEDLMLGIDAVLFLEGGIIRHIAIRTGCLRCQVSVLPGGELLTCIPRGMPELETFLRPAGPAHREAGLDGCPPLCSMPGGQTSRPGLHAGSIGRHTRFHCPRPDHRYISDPDSPPPSREYTDGLLEVVPSLEGMVLRRETLLHSYSIPVFSSLLHLSYF
ncbi:hypothetical protein ACSBR1_005904 [Camellia fascicularis]